MVATVCLQLNRLCDYDSFDTTRDEACQPCDHRNDCSSYYRDINFISRRRVAPDFRCANIFSLCEYFVEGASPCRAERRRQFKRAQTMLRSEIPALCVGDQKIAKRLNARHGFQLFGIDEIGIERDGVAL